MAGEFKTSSSENDTSRILDYETVEPDAGIAFIVSMRRWRSACGWFFWATVAGLYCYRPVGLSAAAGAVCCSVMTLIYLGRAATHEVGVGYAARHITLAILLMPFLLLGIYIVPPLVESDMLNWRRTEEYPNDRPKPLGN